MLRSLLSFLLIFAAFPAIFAQNFRIGEWASYIPYHAGTWVTESETQTWFATQYGLLALNKSDNSPSFYDKANLLSDIGTSVIRYHNLTKTLLVTYQNSGIDLVKADGNVTNLSDITNNTNIIGSKTIYQVNFHQNIAYLSTGFGVVALDMTKESFAFTTFTNFRVNETCVFNNRLYAATDRGVYSVNIQNPNLNIADFGLWEKSDFLGENYQSRGITVFKNQLVFDMNDTLATLINDISYQKIASKPDANLRTKYISSGVNTLIWGMVDCCGQDGKVLLFKNLTDSPQNAGFGCVSRPQYAIEDSRGGVQYADDFEGFRHTATSNPLAACMAPTYNSPYIPRTTSIAISPLNQDVFLTHGGIGIDEGYLGDPFGFEKYNNNNFQWQRFTGDNTPIMSREAVDRDAYRVIVSPTSGIAYVGTHWGGIIEQQPDGTINRIFTDQNSSLRSAPGDAGLRERVAGLSFDKSGNLWVTNTLAPNPIVVRDKSEKWYSFDSPNPNIYNLAIDSSNIKWFTIGKPNFGVMAFSEGKDLTNISDDKVKIFDNSNSVLSQLNAPQTNCLAVDLDGKVWVGTSNGVVVFECGSNPFSDNCKGSLRVSSLDSIGEYLLRGQNVRAIAIDGANRKWFGTSAGLFVQSADGTKAVERFTSENSPLLSNSITALTINPKTGLVWIGTDGGLMSYQSNAVAGGTINRDTAFAFPNPVRPSYQGDIIVRGLARDAAVKITDTNGRLVFENRAFGGQAVWNGLDLKGQRVQTGVYLVFAANDRNLDFADAIVTKILFINE